MTESATLQCNTQISKPPYTFGFMPLLFLTTTFSFTPTLSYYKQAILQKCWQKPIETKLFVLEENQTWDYFMYPICETSRQ